MEAAKRCQMSSFTKLKKGYAMMWFHGKLRTLDPQKWRGCNKLMGVASLDPSRARQFPCQKDMAPAHRSLETRKIKCQAVTIRNIHFFKTCTATVPTEPLASCLPFNGCKTECRLRKNNNTFLLQQTKHAKTGYVAPSEAWLFSTKGDVQNHPAGQHREP